MNYTREVSLLVGKYILRMSRQIGYSLNFLTPISNLYVCWLKNNCCEVLSAKFFILSIEKHARKTSLTLKTGLKSGLWNIFASFFSCSQQPTREHQIKLTNTDNYDEDFQRVLSVEISVKVRV